MTHAAISSQSTARRFVGLPALLVATAATLVAAPVAAAPWCRPGFVWREAYAGDWVCVTPDRRAAADRDDDAAPSRLANGGGAYGASTCRQGFVWREARPNDRVCVTPQDRSTTADENRLAASRVAGHPIDTADATLQLRSHVQALQRLRTRKEAALAQARRRADEVMANLRREDERWMREHPGLGRTSQPSIADNVTPLRTDIQAIDKAIAAAEREAASMRPAPVPAPAPNGGG